MKLSTALGETRIPHLLPNATAEREGASFRLWQLPNQTPTQMMSYVIRTRDGKVVILDGGTAGDAPFLAEFVKGLGATVHAWFISHVHSDHVDALREILTSPGGIRIDTIYGSLPEEGWIERFGIDSEKETDRLLRDALAEAGRRPAHSSGSRMVPGGRLSHWGRHFSLGRNDGGCRGAVHASSDPEAVKRVVELAVSRGIPGVYFYGIDEATGERLTSQRPQWEAARRAGGKVFVAGYATNFDLGMGDIQDLLICWGQPRASEAERWHSVGHKIWCYCNPQGGIENPEVYRRNFGLLLWKANHDGAATFSFQAAAGNAWNDFDDPKQRDFMFAYPTIDGVIDTLAWEGYREGVDDIRYATTMVLAIREARESGNREAGGTALAAERWLADLDTVRQEMVDFILRLRQDTRRWRYLGARVPPSTGARLSRRSAARCHLYRSAVYTA